MNEELHHAWQRFRDDDDAFVLIITGAGDTTFCAGWDLQDAAELSGPGDYDRYRRDLYNLPGACGYTRGWDHVPDCRIPLDSPSFSSTAA